jgi:hypothetical protein
VRVLDFGNNSISEAGVASLAQLLAVKPHLKELNLYMNDIGNSGAAKVGGARGRRQGSEGGGE